MNTHINTTHDAYYPIVTSHINNDPTPRDQAIYIPSVTPGYAIDAYNANWSRDLPQGVDAGDLNFLNPSNTLFRCSHVMSSAGQALNQTRDCIITTRDRANTMLLCDSGGYQIASGRLKINGDPDRMAILRWIEKHGNLGMTLDVPTGPLRRPGYAYKTFADCLADTLTHVKFFANKRASNDLRLLNVIQGNTPSQADQWYDAVKGYNFEGWAFGGPLRNNIPELCRRIIVMTKENQLQDKSWIHILGTCELDTAVMLTAIQRSINRYINPNLRISFDTSSPFRNIAYGKIYTIPNFTNEQMTMPTRSIPDGSQYVGSGIRWPWPSPLGDRMTLGDACVQHRVTANNYHDKQSNHYFSHHNLAALCWGIALANRVFDSENMNHVHTIARPVGAAVEAIDDVLRMQSLYKLKKYQTTFAGLRHSTALTSDDEERSF